MKKMFLTLVALLCTIGMYAQSFTYTYSGTTLCYTVIEGTTNVQVSAVGSVSGSITIPSSVTYSGTTYTVTEIEKNGFNDKTGLTAVKYPTTLTAIGGSAFEGCTNLAKFYSTTTSSNVCNISSKFTKVGLDCFRGCAFESAILNLDNYAPDANSVNYGRCFSGCTKLTNVRASGIIPYGMFQGCSALTTVNITSSTNPNAKIEEGAFRNLPNLSAVGFSGTSSCTEIGRYAFSGCKKLTSITLPGVTSIRDYAFSGTGLTNVYFSGTLKEIGEMAFYACDLTSLSIPSNVRTIANRAFDSNRYLNEVSILSDYVTSSKTPFTQIFSNSPVSTLKFMSGITTIGSNLCFGMEYLQSLELPASGLETIGARAFMGCSILTSVNAINCNNIEKEAFKSSPIEDLNISAQSIGTGAFADNNNLGHAKLRTLTSSMQSCFRGSGRDGYVEVLPQTVDGTIGAVLAGSNFKSALYDCKGKSIDRPFFVDCPYLESVKLVNPGNFALTSNFITECPALKEIGFYDGTTESEYLKVIDNCVYSKDGTKLLLSPQAKETHIIPPATLREVGMCYPNQTFDFTAISSAANVPNFDCIYEETDAPTVLLTNQGVTAFNTKFEDDATRLNMFRNKWIVVSGNPGDVNLDGKVSISDVSKLVDILQGQ